MCKLFRSLSRHGRFLGCFLLCLLLGGLTMAQGWDDVKIDDHSAANFPVYDLQRNMFDIDEDQQTIIQLVMTWEKAFLKENFIALEGLFSLPFYAVLCRSTNCK